MLSSREKHLLNMALDNRTMETEATNALRALRRIIPYEKVPKIVEGVGGKETINTVYVEVEKGKVVRKWRIKFTLSNVPARRLVWTLDQLYSITDVYVFDDFLVRVRNAKSKPNLAIINDLEVSCRCDDIPYNAMERRKAYILKVINSDKT